MHESMGAATAVASARWYAFAREMRLPTPTERATMAGLAAEPRVAVNLAMGAALLICWVAAYWETWCSLVQRWNADSNYSHGFLVPIVSVYLALQARSPKEGLVQPKGGTFVGGAVVLFGCCIGYITVLFPSLVAECFSMLTVLAGGVLLLGGWGWWRLLRAPVLFLLFMAPWPSALYSRIAFPLQLFVSQISTILIEATGVPVFREGNVIHLPRQSMHVAEACSGLRQLTAFLAICTCGALLMKRPGWYRTILLASSIPIAVVINVLRVTATGLVLQYGDAAWTEGTMHTVEGLVMVALGLGLVMLEIKLLDWMLESEPAKQPTFAAAPQPV